ACPCAPPCPAWELARCRFTPVGPFPPARPGRRSVRSTRRRADGGDGVRRLGRRAGRATVLRGNPPASRSSWTMQGSADGCGTARPASSCETSGAVWGAATSDWLRVQEACGGITRPPRGRRRAGGAGRRGAWRRSRPGGPGGRRVPGRPRRWRCGGVARVGGGGEGGGALGRGGGREAEGVGDGRGGEAAGSRALDDQADVGGVAAEGGGEAVGRHRGAHLGGNEQERGVGRAQCGAAD